MKKVFLIGLLCLSALVGYAQEEEDWQVGSPKYYEWLDRQTCKEVCGVSFGSSYETAKDMLNKKFGEPSYSFTDENSIIYQYKSYGGISFSSICFYFQRDGFHSYMNQCVMTIDCKTANDAKNKRDYIWSIAKGKYTTWNEGTDKNGFKYYESGISPKEVGLNTGFIVDVVKYDKVYDGYYYCARIMYGPYNYVKEEF